MCFNGLLLFCSGEESPQQRWLWVSGLRLRLEDRRGQEEPAADAHHGRLCQDALQAGEGDSFVASTIAYELDLFYCVLVAGS